MEENNTTIEEQVPAVENDQKQEEEKKNKNTLPEFDYNKATRQEIVDHLIHLINDFSPLEIKSETETIKSVFYSKLTKELELQREKLLTENAVEGEETPVFKPERDELESLLKKELNRYRELKNAIIAKQEKEREDNLHIKEGLIEELKHLVETEESLKDTFEAFHSIVERWRSVGPVPANHNNDLWQTYHLHVENFYDYIKINKDL